MTDIKELITKIVQSAENNIEDVRFIKSMKVGQIVRQGDIYIHKVDDTHPHGGRCGRQLAQGSSKGSRHIAESPAECFTGTQKPTTCEDAVFLGPLVKSPHRFLISHPEHADISLSGGCYQITHQMDVRTQARVRD